MRKIIEILLSLPKTLYCNLTWLPFHQAIRLPIWVHYKTHTVMKGTVKIIPPINTAMIRIGFHTVPAKSKNECGSIIVRGGKLLFCGDAHIGRGSNIYIEGKASLQLGANFAISACTSILCYKGIIIGRDVQFSWDCLLMDSDTHLIYSTEGAIANKPNEIVLGDKVWVGCKTTILKGSKIPNNCVIGAGSLLTGDGYQPNSLIAGSPARTIHKIGGWAL